MGRLVCFDFGKKRIGIAISDELKIIATPLSVIECRHSLKETARLLKEELKARLPLMAIVIGLPLHLSGEESPLSKLVRKFGKVIELAFEVPVIFWDERYSSEQAEMALREGGLSRKKRAAKNDKIAAAIILQNYLDTHL